MSGDKEKCNFYLSSDIMREFKDMCFIKHGSKYGSVAFELEILMNWGISEFKNGGITHTQKGSKALELKRKLMNWLISSKGYQDLHQVRIPIKTLYEGITDIEGCTDRRTIKSRIHLLVSKKCIKESEDSDEQSRMYTFIMTEKKKEESNEVVIEVKEGR